MMFSNSDRENILWGYKSAGKTKTPLYEKCAYSHKPMPVEVEGKTFYLYGGAAGSPVYKECDIFIALDGSTPENKSFYPWNDGAKKIFVSFYITDMSVPKDRAEFRKMIVWASQQVRDGHKVHVGCMGGHGRTGMVLAAMVVILTGNKDAIAYVRKNYCSKAVETEAQVRFLQDEFGINPAGGSKSTPSSSVADFNAKYPAVSLDYIEGEPLYQRGSIWFKPPSAGESVDLPST